MARMFVLSGYDAFVGFLLISAAVPVLALLANKLLEATSLWFGTFWVTGNISLCT